VGVDPQAARRASALGVGATHAVDPSEADPVARVRELTGGRGADFTFEVVGRPELMVQAYEMARVEGTVTLVGMPAVGETVTLPAMSAVFSGKRLVGSAVGGSQVLRDVPRFLRLAEAGRLDLGSLVSRHIKLDEINDGVDGLHRAEGTRTVIV
jgi:S-(hydroxymethyl)glutathione dehydrogenase/alcohol dehydrogenase